MFFYKISAFIKKSFYIQWSYRLAIFLSILGTIGSILTFYFIDRLFGHQIVDHLAPYGVSYFPYVLIGIAFSGFIGTSIGTISGLLNQEQTIGTLEALLVTPTRVENIIGAMISWDLLYAFVQLALYTIMGALFFNVDFSNINIVSTLIITLLSIISFKSLSIISAGFILIFKRGDPVSWLVSIVVELLGGVYFPITVLPGWLETIAGFFPLTYAIRSIEMAIYQGADISELSSDITSLFIFAVVLFPLGILMLRVALKKAKHDGSLIQY